MHKSDNHNAYAYHPTTQISILLISNHASPKTIHRHRHLSPKRKDVKTSRSPFKSPSLHTSSHDSHPLRYSHRPLPRVHHAQTDYAQNVPKAVSAADLLGRWECGYLCQGHAELAEKRRRWIWIRREEMGSRDWNFLGILLAILERLYETAMNFWAIWAIVCYVSGAFRGKREWWENWKEWLLFTQCV